MKNFLEELRKFSVPIIIVVFVVIAWTYANKDNFKMASLSLAFALLLVIFDAIIDTLKR